MKVPAKPVTRVLSQFESQFLFERFEEVHCYKTDNDGHVTHTCPGWDWKLTTLDDNNKEQQGGCAYRNSTKICNCLKLAAEGHYVVEIRPKNEEDVKRENELERASFLEELKKLKLQKTNLEDQILAIESKIRQQI